MSAEELKVKLSKGNELYRQKKFKEAIPEYEGAYNVLKILFKTSDPQKNTLPIVKKIVETMTFMSNCCRNIKDHLNSVKYLVELIQLWHPFHKFDEKELYSLFVKIASEKFQDMKTEKSKKPTLPNGFLAFWTLQQMEKQSDAQNLNSSSTSSTTAIRKSIGPKEIAEFGLLEFTALEFVELENSSMHFFQAEKDALLKILIEIFEKIEQESSEGKIFKTHSNELKIFKFKQKTSSFLRSIEESNDYKKFSVISDKQIPEIIFPKLETIKTFLEELSTFSLCDFQNAAVKIENFSNFKQNILLRLRIFLVFVIKMREMFTEETTLTQNPSKISFINRVLAILTHPPSTQDTLCNLYTSCWKFFCPFELYSQLQQQQTQHLVFGHFKNYLYSVIDFEAKLWCESRFFIEIQRFTKAQVVLDKLLGVSLKSCTDLSAVLSFLAQFMGIRAGETVSVNNFSTFSQIQQQISPKDDNNNINNLYLISKNFYSSVLESCFDSSPFSSDLKLLESELFYNLMFLLQQQITSISANFDEQLVKNCEGRINLLENALNQFKILSKSEKEEDLINLKFHFMFSNFLRTPIEIDQETKSTILKKLENQSQELFILNEPDNFLAIIKSLANVFQNCLKFASNKENQEGIIEILSSFLTLVDNFHQIFQNSIANEEKQRRACMIFSKWFPNVVLQSEIIKYAEYFILKFIYSLQKDEQNKQKIEEISIFFLYFSIFVKNLVQPHHLFFGEDQTSKFNNSPDYNEIFQIFAQKIEYFHDFLNLLFYFTKSSGKTEILQKKFEKQKSELNSFISELFPDYYRFIHIKLTQMHKEQYLALFCFESLKENENQLLHVSTKLISDGIIDKFSKIHGSLKKVLEESGQDDNTSSSIPIRTRNSSSSGAQTIESRSSSISGFNEFNEEEFQSEELQAKEQKEIESKRKRAAVKERQIHNDKWWKKRKELDSNLEKLVVNKLFLTLFGCPEIEKAFESQNEQGNESNSMHSPQSESNSNSDEEKEQNNAMEIEIEAAVEEKKIETQRNSTRRRRRLPKQEEKEESRNENEKQKKGKKRCKKSSCDDFLIGTFSSVLEEKTKEEEEQKKNQEKQIQYTLELNDLPEEAKKLEILKNKIKTSLCEHENISISIFDLFQDSHEDETHNEHFQLIFEDDFLIHTLPWESIPFFRFRSVSRLLTLYFSSIFCKWKSNYNILHTRISHSIETPENVTFLLNPKGDLKSTENEFSNDFNAFQTSLNWKGATHLIPSTREFGNWMKASNLYLYFGHNSGDQYLSLEDIIRENFNQNPQNSQNSASSSQNIASNSQNSQNIASNSQNIAPNSQNSQNIASNSQNNEMPDSLPCSLLMGCSSVNFKQLNWKQLCSDGVANYFMCSNSPCVVGFLWDVTDVDCDRIGSFLLCNWLLLEPHTKPKGGKLWAEERAKATVELMKKQQQQQLKKNQNQESLCEVLAFARRSTKMQFLTGAAVVCYGFPVFRNAIAIQK